jgi:hypothetical protein
MVPPEHAWLFWDVDPAGLDTARDRDYVLERVMVRGDWAAMRWVLRAYPRAVVAEFLGRKGATLPPREEAFWSLISGRAVTQRPGGGRPPWAG